MNPNLIKELREKTGAGFLECKKALEECRDDIEKAREHLRKRGMADASKRLGRAVSEGIVQSYIHGNGKIGVLLELNCETDFVGKTDEFHALAHNITMHIAASNPRYLNREAVPPNDLEKEKEIFRTQAESSGKKGPMIEKIVEGKISKFYEESCLLHQPYIREPEKSVDTLIKEMIAKVGENIAVKRFVRFQVGESSKG